MYKPSIAPEVKRCWRRSKGFKQPVAAAVDWGPSGGRHARKNLTVGARDWGKFTQIRRMAHDGRPLFDSVLKVGVEQPFAMAIAICVLPFWLLRIRMIGMFKFGTGSEGRSHDYCKTNGMLKFPCGGFLSHRGTPKSSIHFRLGFSIINHPAIGVPPWLWKPACSHRFGGIRMLRAAASPFCSGRANCQAVQPVQPCVLTPPRSSRKQCPIGCRKDWMPNHLAIQVFTSSWGNNPWRPGDTVLWSPWRAMRRTETHGPKIHAAEIWWVLVEGEIRKTWEEWFRNLIPFNS